MQGEPPYRFSKVKAELGLIGACSRRIDASFSGIEMLIFSRGKRLSDGNKKTWIIKPFRQKANAKATDRISPICAGVAVLFISQPPGW